MANPNRRKGTGFENWLVPRLQAVFGSHVSRRDNPNHPGDDFYGTPFPVQAKKRQQWSTAKWASQLRAISPYWALIIAPPDTRLKASPPTVMVLPIQLGLDALAAWWHDTPSITLATPTIEFEDDVE